MSERRNPFAERLRKAIIDKRLTQKDVATLLGCHQTSISSWLRGGQVPTKAKTIKRLAEFLDTTQADVKALTHGRPERTRIQARNVPDLKRQLADIEAAHRPLNIPVVEGTLRWARAHGLDFDDEEAFRRWHRESLPREPRLPNAVGIRDSINRLNDALRNPPHRIPLGTAIDLLGHELLAKLEDYKQITRDVDSIVGLWLISPDYILNKSEGYSLGIRGLDFLFDGGLLPMRDGGPIVLIAGDYGMGKSTMAMEIAAMMAHQGQVVIYLSTEEPTTLLSERLAYLGYSPKEIENRSKEQAGFFLCKGQPDNRTFFLTTSNFVSEPAISSWLTDSDQRANGLLLLVSMAPPFSALTDRSDELTLGIESVRKRYQQRRVTVVIDSLDAVTQTSDRESLNSYFIDQRRPGLTTFFVTTKNSHLASFLADVVIRLDERERADFLTERTVQIVKCRSQNHFRDAHSFTIQNVDGVTVTPSITSRLRVWNRKYDIQRSGQPAFVWASPQTAYPFDLETALLGGDVTRGSSALAHGVAGTHKLPLALSFLSGTPRVPESALRDIYFEQGVLISFIEDESQLLEVARTYNEQFHLVDETTSRGTMFRHGISVLTNRLDTFSPDRVFEWLRTELKDRFGRAVIYGLGTRVAQSIKADEARLLYTALMALFRKQNITGLFLESTATVAGFDLSDVFDVVIHLERAEKTKGVNLSVRRSALAHSVGHAVLVERRSNPPHLHIDIKPSG